MFACVSRFAEVVVLLSIMTPVDPAPPQVLVPEREQFIKIGTKLTP